MIYQTQKPVPVIRWILDKYGEKGMKILDPFTGSGSILLASKQKGCEFMGFEINKEYCDVASKRLQQEVLI